MNIISQFAQYAGCITTIITLVCILVKPIREKIFGLKAIKDGQKCMLRSDMLRIYYQNKDSRTIRQFEYENFLYEYNAYKALNGNSFIGKIKKEIDEFEVIY